MGYRLNLDVRHGYRRSVPEIRLRDGDHGMELAVTVTEYGGEFQVGDYGARLVAVLADGSYVEDSAHCKTDGDVITYVIQPELSAVQGRAKTAYFELRDVDGKLVETTDSFVLVALSKADLSGGQATTGETLIAQMRAAVASANTATGRANSAADEAKAFLEGFIVGYDNLSDECKAYIASCASSGMVFASAEDIDDAFEEEILPVIAGGGSGKSGLTEDDFSWALGRIFG